VTQNLTKIIFERLKILYQFVRGWLQSIKKATLSG